ncbi:MAG TPA: UPF0182 family protein, partial [Patescibacteria group bacterium]|nr:UPF0182 family protein [Patescibacteria group bacterium]
MKKKSLTGTILLGLIIFALFFGTSIIHILTDWYWFQSIDYANIFKTIISTKIILGSLVGLLFFLFLYGNSLIAAKISKKEPQVIGKDTVKKLLSFKKIGNKISLIISLIISFIVAIVASNSWQTVLKYLNATPFSKVDPILGKDVSFYIFEMPFIQFLLGIGFFLVISTIIATGLIYIKNGLLTLKAFFSSKFSKRVKTHISVLLFLFFALVALNLYFIKIPGLLLNQTELLLGANYSIIHGALPMLKVLLVIALALALISLINIWKANYKLLKLGLITYGLVLVVGVWIYPTILQKLVVEPNELKKETPYIQNHITMTRSAYDLDRIKEERLDKESDLTIEDINENSATIKNIRIWDRDPLLDTFTQLQAIRTYYDFDKIDNDRYHLGKDYRQVLLSTRELDSTKLPQQSFINKRLTFTHGFGLTLAPVNETTPEGLPNLFLKDLPPQSQFERFKINRPEIYYGESLIDWVVTKTGTKEFDYPKGNENVFTNYQGTGGVEIGSSLKKIMFALRFQSAKLFLSNDINDDSRIMFYRDIKARVKKVLPFLRFDKDPYVVINKDGHLKWMLDGYTTSPNFPYSQRMVDMHASRYSELIPQINYIRNSVKIVLDAYNGQMKFYVSDENDPLIKTYSKIFDNTFLSFDKMPDDIRAHIRYPEDIFKYQTDLYAKFHMKDPKIFYNREDQWEIPTNFTGKRIDPMMRHIIMKLPGENQEEFILMIPFTPKEKDNLAAWMVARNDGEDYGNLIVYRFPKQKLIYGPDQIMGRINQDTKISQQISLWDQRGSSVLRGSLLVIPI